MDANLRSFDSLDSTESGNIAETQLGASLHATRSTQRPRNLLLLSAGVLGVLTLRTTVSFFFLIFLISIVTTYANAFIVPQHSYKNATLLWGMMTIATVVARLGPSTSALSSSPVGILSLILLSAIATKVAVLAIWIGAYALASSRLTSPHAKLLVFPAIWTSVWAFIAYLTPLGRLVAWSPDLSSDAHRWILPIAGTPGVDWMVAAWATLASQIIETHVLAATTNAGSPLLIDLVADPADVDPEDSQPQGATARPTSQSGGGRNAVFSLGFLLVLLEVVSTFGSNTPLPVSSLSSTQVVLGCALPSSVYGKPANTHFDDYLAVTKKMTAAHIVIWPEGAVRFENAKLRDAAFQRVSKEIPATYVGVSFEEDTSDKRINGFALVGPHGVVLQYEKRNLVPIAESYAFRHSNVPPPLIQLNLTAPKKMTKPDWNPVYPHTRPLMVTTSICLDFASPTVFSSLEERPALILGPARTWHPDVAKAMWAQASARAEEVGSTLLWCDGGKSGISGVAGNGVQDIIQVGEGYWLRKVGIRWPFETYQTIYARAGDFAAVAVVWIMVLDAYLVTPITANPGKFTRQQVVRRMRQALRDVRDHWRRRRSNPEATPLLVDV